MAIAHRGAHDDVREENSLEAVQHAIELGAHAIEFDVCNTVDGSLVLAHDRWVENADGVLDITTSIIDEIDGLDTVDRHLELVADSEDVLLNFDWKGDGEERTVGELLERYGLTERTIVSGTDPAPLAEVKRHLPELTTGLSVNTAHDDLVDRMRGCGADAVMVSRWVVSEDLVSTIHQAGGGCFVWTAPDVATFDRLAQLGPDGIATDVIEDQLRVTP